MFIDGKPVYQFAPKDGAKADPERAHPIDLTSELTPGRHALVISAPRNGFALEGQLQYAQEAAPIQSDGAWQVMKFAPTVILEVEPWMQPQFSTGDGTDDSRGQGFEDAGRVVPPTRGATA